jgi:hypothetical protein
LIDPNQVQKERDTVARTADTLRTLTNTLVGQRGKEALTSAAFHLEQCVHQCDDTIKGLKNTVSTR